MRHPSKLVLIITAMIILPSLVGAGDADILQILKISPQDERAVIKTPDGKMQIIKPGDFVGESGKVTEIVTDRIVIEQKKGKEMEKIIIRLVDGKQKVERMRKTGEQPQPIFVPAERDKRTEKQQNSFN